MYRLIVAVFFIFIVEPIRGQCDQAVLDECLTRLDFDSDITGSGVLSPEKILAGEQSQHLETVCSAYTNYVACTEPFQGRPDCDLTSHGIITKLYSRLCDPTIQGGLRNGQACLTVALETETVKACHLAAEELLKESNNPNDLCGMVVPMSDYFRCAETEVSSQCPDLALYFDQVYQPIRDLSSLCLAPPPPSQPVPPELQPPVGIPAEPQPPRVPQPVDTRVPIDREPVIENPGVVVNRPPITSPLECTEAHTAEYLRCYNQLATFQSYLDESYIDSRYSELLTNTLQPAETQRLDEMCRAYSEYATCSAGVMHCRSESAQHKYIRTTMRFLCDVELRSLAANHAQCVQAIKTDPGYDQCRQEMTTNLDAATSNVFAQDSMTDFCVSWNSIGNFFVCVTPQIASACDPSSIDFLSTLDLRVTQTQIEEHCTDLMIGPPPGLPGPPEPAIRDPSIALVDPPVIESTSTERRYLCDPVQARCAECTLGGTCPADVALWQTDVDCATNCPPEPDCYACQDGLCVPAFGLACASGVTYFTTAACSASCAAAPPVISLDLDTTPIVQQTTTSPPTTAQEAVVTTTAIPSTAFTPRPATVSSASPQCPPNESYLDCGSACFVSCQFPKPGPCTDNCVPGCFCVDGFIRDLNSQQCVLPETCPPSPFGPEATPPVPRIENQTPPPCNNDEMFDPCGSPCPPTCEGTDLNQPCPASCNPACFCKPGYLRSLSSGTCVPQEQCPAVPITVSPTEVMPNQPTPPNTTCGRSNELYNQCGSACPVTCQFPEPQACTKHCVPGCYCAQGYIRDSRSGECVMQGQCSVLIDEADETSAINEVDSVEDFFQSNVTNPLAVICPDHEFYQDCGSRCVATCAQPMPSVCTTECVAACFCMEGYLRDTTTGICVTPETCTVHQSADPPLTADTHDTVLAIATTSGAAEPGTDIPVVVTSTSTVPDLQTTTAITEPQVTTTLQTVAANKETTPVLATEAPVFSFATESLVTDGGLGLPSSPAPDCPDNEFYQTCGTACPLTCQSPEPRACTRQCVTGCYCVDGFLRDEDSGRCTAVQECPAMEQRVFVPPVAVSPSAVPPASTASAEVHYFCAGDTCQQCLLYQDCPADIQLSPDLALCQSDCPPVSLTCSLCDVHSQSCLSARGLICLGAGSYTNTSACLNACSHVASPSCGPNELYDACGSPCLRTCDSPNPTDCDLACMPGCFCVDGFVRDMTTGDCVTASSCPALPAAIDYPVIEPQAATEKPIEPDVNLNVTEVWVAGATDATVYYACTLDTCEPCQGLQCPQDIAWHDDMTSCESNCPPEPDCYLCGPDIACGGAHGLGCFPNAAAGISMFGIKEECMASCSPDTAQCEANAEFAECNCGPTCSDPEAGRCAELYADVEYEEDQCRAGCICSAGYVFDLNSNQCVSPDQCSAASETCDDTIICLFDLAGVTEHVEDFSVRSLQKLANPGNEEKLQKTCETFDGYRSCAQEKEVEGQCIANGPLDRLADAAGKIICDEGMHALIRKHQDCLDLLDQDESFTICTGRLGKLISMDKITKLLDDKGSKESVCDIVDGLVKFQMCSEERASAVCEPEAIELTDYFKNQVDGFVDVNDCADYIARGGAAIAVDVQPAVEPEPDVTTSTDRAAAVTTAQVIPLVEHPYTVSGILYDEVYSPVLEDSSSAEYAALSEKVTQQFKDSFGDNIDDISVSISKTTDTDGDHVVGHVTAMTRYYNQADFESMLLQRTEEGYVRMYPHSLQVQPGTELITHPPQLDKTSGRPVESVTEPAPEPEPSSTAGFLPDVTFEAASVPSVPDSALRSAAALLTGVLPAVFLLLA